MKAHLPFKSSCGEIAVVIRIRLFEVEQKRIHGREKDAQGSGDGLQDEKTVAQPDFRRRKAVGRITGVVEQKVKLAFEFIQVNDGGIVRNIPDYGQLFIIVFDA